MARRRSPARSSQDHAARRDGSDAAALVELLGRIEARASDEAGTPVPLSVCFEIDSDGFWFSRFLIDRGIEGVSEISCEGRAVILFRPWLV